MESYIIPYIYEHFTESQLSGIGLLTILLGAITGLLFIALIATTLGWCVSCVVLKKKLLSM